MPGFNAPASDPTASMTPLISMPGVWGSAGLTWYLPSATSAST
jgi:hypothetical protein